MGKVNQSFKMAIQSYLEKKAKEDSLFAVTYAKDNKNLDECCDYIIGEARKRGGNAVAMTDDEVFGIAIHYYDEDDIKVNKLPKSVRTSVSSPKVKLTEEQYASIKKKPSKRKEKDVQQMTLF